MKLEVGQFVRTKEGYIAKFIGKNDYFHSFDSSMRDISCLVYDEDNMLFNDEIKEYITKVSCNIIDLIEEGDLIKHEKIGIKQIKDKDKFSQYIWYSKNHNPLNCDLEDAITFEAFESEFEVGNISILTKELFEDTSYKVEG